MRPSLLPGLIAAAGRNAARGFADSALFEVGQIFVSEDEKGQRIAAAGVRRGLATAQSTRAQLGWRPRRRPASIDAKADAFALLQALGVAVGGLQIVAGGPDWLHPGRSGTLQFGPKAVIGHFGELHPRRLLELDVEGPLAAFEIYLDALPAQKAKADQDQAAPGSVGFAAAVARFRLYRRPRRAGGRSAEGGARRRQGADRGRQVFSTSMRASACRRARNRIGVAVTLQPREKTLTDAEIEALAQKIVAEAAKKTGATLRG